MAATQSEENPVDSKHSLNKRLCLIVLLNGACVPASFANTGVEINGEHMRRREILRECSTMTLSVSKNPLASGDPVMCLDSVLQNP